MIKVLFLIPSLSGGGAEKVLRNLVNNMDLSKFEITVQTINEEDANKHLKKEIRYKTINSCKSKWGQKLFQYWFRFCAEFKLAYPLYIKDDYDIEVAYLECGATKILSSSTNKKALKLAWVHCDLSRKEGMSSSVSKVRKQYEAYDEVVCVSEDVRTGFHKLYGDGINTKVIYNIIDEEEILKKSVEVLECNEKAEGIQLLAIGRLCEQKNFSYLIETCGKLRDAGYQFQLNILGEGPERNHLKKLIKLLGLESFVRLRGFTQNPYAWMKQSDVVVCSSKYEGISTVVQEAFILGKPIVTTPCTGMKELLGESQYGIIAENSELGLYDSLCHIIENQNVLKHYGEMALKRHETFSKGKILGETEEYFQNKLLGKIEE